MTAELNSIDSRISSLESRFNTHTSKIEDKLDQIFNMMNSVTSLRERDVTHETSIIELRSNMKEISQQLKESVERIHSKLELMEENSQNRYSKHSSEVEIKILNEKSMMEARIEKMNEKLLYVDENVNKWINRGSGAWAVAALFIVFVQSVGAYFLSELKESYRTQTQQIVDLQKRVTETEKTGIAYMTDKLKKE